MGLLDGGAAALFGEIFSPLYLPAVLTRQTTTYVAGRPRREAQHINCRAQVERATERMIATEGYTQTDRAIYILAASLAGEVDTDCEIEVQEGPYAGVPFRISSPIDRDPGAAYWLCRGVEKKGG